MRALLNEEAKFISDVIGEYCAICQEANDTSDCERCRISDFTEFVEPKVIVYIDSRNHYAKNGTRFRFTFSDGGTVTLTTHIIDITHLSTVQLDNNGKEKPDSEMNLHHLQFEDILRGAKTAEVFVDGIWTDLEKLPCFS